MDGVDGGNKVMMYPSLGACKDVMEGHTKCGVGAIRGGKFRWEVQEFRRWE